MLGGAWTRPAALTVIFLLVLAAVLHKDDVRSAAAALPLDRFARGTAAPQLERHLVARHAAVAPGDPDGYRPPVPAAGVTVDPSVLWGREFLLDGPSMERGVTFGDSSRLRMQVARLMAGEHVRLTAVGASITSGAGGCTWVGTRTNYPGYAPQFEDWLRAAFPRANASLHNAGMAGTFSGVFSQCFDTLIPPADIYILEQTTFDGTEPDKCYCRDHYVNTPVQLGVERLIRRMLRAPGHPAVLLLNAYGFRFPNREVYQRSVENQVQVMGQFYGLPMASLRAAAWRQMLQSGHGFDVSTTVKRLEGAALDKFPLYYDEVHPWGPTGHRMLAELLIRMVQATAAGLSIQPLSGQEAAGLSGEGQGEGELLPPPLTPNNYETNSSSCWLGDDFHTLVDAADGFAWINERPEATEKKAQKWGFVATQPGSYLEFSVDTRAASGPAAQQRVVLSYLASYQGMGVARVECVGGCECKAVEIDALWVEQASMLMTQELKATQHAACRVRVTVRRRTRSGGNKFKLAGVMVLPSGTHEFSPNDRLDVVVPQLFDKV